MANKEYSAEEYYYLIGGRIVWDSEFLSLLIRNPGTAFKTVLRDAQIELPPEQMSVLLEGLEAKRKEFKGKHGLENIFDASLDYIRPGSTTEMV